MPTMSLRAASGKNATPSFCTSSSYCCRYVSRFTSRPGIGHSLMPSLSTSQRCSPISAKSSPGMAKTCTAKKRDSVRPAMIGPPRSTCTT